MTRARAQAVAAVGAAAGPRRRAGRGADHRGGRPVRRRRRAPPGGGRRWPPARYDWVVFTSPRAVERLRAPAARRPGLRLRRDRGHRPRHRDRRWPRHRVVADLVPAEFVAESLVEAFPCRDGAGAAAPAGRGPGRAARGPARPRGGPSTWSRPTGPSRPRRAAEVLAAAAGADAITFTSSSTVTNYLAVAGRDRLPPARGLHRAGHRGHRHGRRHPGRRGRRRAQHRRAGRPPCVEGLAATGPARR